MNLSYLLSSSLFLILFKWTCLLALGWVCDWVLRRRHARWRLILWRGVLCAGLVLPLAQFLRIPGIRIPVAIGNGSVTEPVQPLPAVANLGRIQPPTTSPQPSTMPAKASLTATGAESQQPRTQTLVRGPFPWGIVITGFWMLGCIYGIGRLVAVKLKLSQLQAGAVPAAGCGNWSPAWDSPGG